MTIEEPQLRRELGFYDGIGIVVGIMIGSGIFASPGTALSAAGSPALALAAWALAAVLVAVASLAYSELGAMLPRAGGDAEYLRAAYGERAAFCFVWANFWVLKPGSQALIATIFGEYAARALLGAAAGRAAARALAVAAVVALTALNMRGVRATANTMNALTAAKVCLLVALFCGGAAHAASAPRALRDNFARARDGFDAASPAAWGGFGRAMIACLWAFDGWADLGSLAEELRAPERLLPRVIAASVVGVGALYLVANAAYFSVLSADAIEDSSAVAIDFARALGGGNGAAARAARALVAGGVALSTLGACNGSMMTGGRVFYAVARDGQIPRAFAALNARGAPARVLAAQGGWCVALLLTPGADFGALLDYFGPASWVFYALTGSAALTLRRTRPELPRPFRMPLFPLPPILVGAMALALAASSLARSPAYCALALGFCATALPVHHFFVARRACGCCTPHAQTPASDPASEGYERVEISTN